MCIDLCTFSIQEIYDHESQHFIMTIWDEFLTAKSTFRWIKPKKVKILHLLTIKLCYFWQSLSSFKTLIKTTEHRQSLHNTFSNICGANDKFFWSLPCSKLIIQWWYNKKSGTYSVLMIGTPINKVKMD